MKAICLWVIGMVAVNVASETLSRAYYGSFSESTEVPSTGWVGFDEGSTGVTVHRVIPKKVQRLERSRGRHDSMTPFTDHDEEGDEYHVQRCHHDFLLLRKVGLWRFLSCISLEFRTWSGKERESVEARYWRWDFVKRCTFDSSSSRATSIKKPAQVHLTHPQTRPGHGVHLISYAKVLRRT